MKFLTHFRFGMLLLFFLNVIGQSKAQDVWNAPNGVDVSIFAYGSDGLDIRWYGITVHHDWWSTDDWRFIYGNNSENDKVQGDEAKKRPDYGSNANFVWSFQKVGNNNTNQTDIPICIWNRGAEGYISATTNKPEISKSFTVLRFSIPQQNDWKAFKLLFSSDWGNAAEIGKTLKVWKDGGALDFSANQMLPYKKDAYFRVYDAGWTDREAVIYAAMKNSVGAYAGASLADFTNIDTEYGKDILIRNFKKIRNDLATLQTKYNNQPTTLPSGFYRIRSGYSGFNGKSGNEERVMYVDSSNKKVKWKNGNQTDGIWRVIANNDGSYTLTHYNTGCTFTTPSKEAVLSGNAKVQIQPIYQQWFPGYYSISVSDQYAYAEGHSTGTAENGNIIAYSNPETTNRLTNIYRGYDQKREFPSSSSWLFTKVEQTIPSDIRDKANELLAAKDVARGFTSSQLKHLEELLANPLTIPTEINTEIEKLLDESRTKRIPFTNGFYTIINAHRDFENKPHRLLYAEPQGNPLWHIKDGNPETKDVWYVEKTSGGYVLTNVNSTLTIQRINERLRGKPYEMTVFEINKQKYPARFLVHDKTYQYMHALGHHATAPNNSSGTIVGSYNGNDYQRENGHMVDGASTWKFKPLEMSSVPTATELETIVSRHLSSENRIFGYDTNQLRPLKNATNAGSRFKAIYDMRKQGRRQPDANGLNRIYNAAVKYATDRKTVYLDYNARTPKWHSGNMTKVDELWRIKGAANGAGSYEVTNPNTNTSIASHATMSDSHAACLITELDGYTLPSVIRITAGGSVLNPLGNGDGKPEGTLVHWDKPGGSPQSNYTYVNADNGTVTSIDQTSTWYIEPATTIGLTTSVLGSGTPKQFFLTFYYPFAVELPEELSMNSSGSMWAYVERDGASSERPGYILVKPVRGKKIKPLTPVVLETRERRNLITLKIIPENQADVEVRSQVWKGVLAPMEIPAGSYIMINHSSWSGFHRTTESGYIAANRVYVQGSGTASAPRYFGIHTDDESTTTGVEEMTSEEVRKSPVLYDMMGRRVTNPGKGIYVTSEGKKIYKL